MKHNTINTENETLKNKYPHASAYVTKLEDGAWHVFDSKGEICNGPFPSKEEAEYELVMFLNMVNNMYWAHRPEIHNAVQLFFRLKHYRATASELEKIIRMYLTPYEAQYGCDVSGDSVDFLVWTMAEQGDVVR